MNRIVLAAAALWTITGCQVRSVPFTFDGEVPGSTGGNGGGASDRIIFGIGGHTGDGSATGGSGDGGRTLPDGRPINCDNPKMEICNGLDDDCDGVVDNGFDLSTDNGNCGACGAVCTFPHSLPQCVAGKCGVQDCLPGYVDVDTKPDNGCECLTTNGGVEICDGADNNCNGKTDEGFDFKTDTTNCGGCNKFCEYAHAGATCQDGTCAMGACEAGHINLNKDGKDGCEYSCTPTNNSIEICDGMDNDCDGGIDNNPTGAGTPCGPATSGVGECQRGKLICTSGQLICYGSGEPNIETCDGKDNDCDGSTDEDFDKLNDVRFCGNCKPCAFAHGVPKCTVGVCQLDGCSPGYVNLNQVATDGCEYSCTFRGVDICNGVDDDCDGMVDEGINKNTDVTNCGACANVCRYSNAAVSCNAGQCMMGGCDLNFYNLDGQAGNGCEYFCVATGPERCDGVDNNCDGKIDEGFNLASDPLNCGACGSVCRFGFAAATCSNSICQMGACDADHYDLNNVPGDGCEYACVKTNGGVEICDAKDNDCDAQIDETDPQLGNRCYPNLVAGCNVAANTCKGTCAFGTLACIGGGLACRNPVVPRTDICDNIDNDCDGTVDQDFDKSGDPRFCGSCTNACQYDHAIALCNSGTCQRGPCSTGFVDLDGLPGNGCEYTCTADGPEVCDGKDNDCDGKTDAADSSLLYPTTNFCVQAGECGKGPGGSTQYPGQNTFPECTTYAGATQPDWVCNYPATVETTGANQIAGQESWCDGKDNDCDTAIDEHIAAGALGGSCFDPTEVGECRRSGIMRCQADRTAQPACDFTGVVAGTPGNETCDGKDNDCDGLTDESWDNPGGLGLPTCSGVACTGVRDDIVHVTVAATPYYVYKHEASHVDASGSSAGSSGARACSRGSVLPWTSVTYTQAQVACAAAGMRLCRTTRSGGCGQGAVTTDEWGFACQYNQACASGAYPYSCTYDPNTCNGAETGNNQAVTGGLLAACVTKDDLDTTLASTQQLNDMSGNVAEWTEDCRGTLSDGRIIYTVRGGAYNSYDTALRCDFMVSQLASNFSYPDTGFRCCSSCAPGLADCSGSCVNLASSSTNCGACGTTCGGGTTCTNGVCR